MHGLDADQLSTIPHSGTQQDVTVDSNLTPDVETEGHGIGWHVHVLQHAHLLCVGTAHH